MAEGGPLQEKQVNEENFHLPAYHLLECPICLEQMRKPKSLPCLHSFCEKCLGTYIVTDLSGEMAAVTSFPCPVCRKITSPVNLAESKEMWAQQFPTNSHVRKLINLQDMSTDTQLYCGPCSTTQNLKTEAQLWCKTNDMLLCESCKTHFHDVIHKVCDIVTINETNRDVTWKLPLLTACSTHNEKMDCYCEEHKFIGCNKCIIRDHRRCDAVTTTNEYCEKQKSNLRLDDMDKSLDKASNCMELMLNAFDDQVESLQQCQDVGMSSITDLRERINRYLDTKQEEITQDMISTCKSVKAKVDLSKQKCSRLRTAIQNTKEASRTAVVSEDNIGTIQLFHKGQAEIVACNSLIDDMTNAVKSVNIKHDVDASLATVDETSNLTLGGISVDEQSFIIPDGVGYISNVGLLSECRARKIGTCNIKLPSDKKNCFARGVLLMPNDNIIVSDYLNEKLKMFSPEELCLDELKIGKCPRDICIVDNNTVAVASSFGIFKIHIVKVQNSKLSLSSKIKISDGIACHGISFVDGSFVVSTPAQIQNVTMDGKTNISRTLGTDCHHLACCPKQAQLFASLDTSTLGKVALTRLSPWTKADILKVGVVKKAMGVDVDREGNVYVCGQASNNVVQISADGSMVRELLTSKDGIDAPRAISVCGDKFVVTNESSEHLDRVHVFQLY